MKYIIMANGKGSRWGNHRGIPKHLSEIDGETLLGRTARLVKESDPTAEIIVSSSDARCEIPGIPRHEPKSNTYELDRFCMELIEDDVCFLYGDVYYTVETMLDIVSTPVEKLAFWGSSTSIYAVKVRNGSVLRHCLDRLYGKIADGEISDAKGWQVYHLYMGMPLAGHDIDGDYIIVADETIDFNHPEDYENFIARRV